MGRSVREMFKNIEDTFSQTTSYVAHIVKFAELLCAETFHSDVLLAATNGYKIIFSTSEETRTK